MATNLFSSSITIRVKGSLKKFTWSHHFTPEDLSFQETLIPIFLKDVSIPEAERPYLTKELRKILLQVRNIQPVQFEAPIADIKEFIKANNGKTIRIEAHGIGVHILSMAMKNSQGTFHFLFHNFPFALLDKNFQKKLSKNKNASFIYSKDTPFAQMKTLLGPNFKLSSKTKNLVA
ncbi:MAG: hypothetical protein ACOYL6_07175 [Bacteriovoracaceae bacterium]